MIGGSCGDNGGSSVILRLILTSVEYTMVAVGAMVVDLGLCKLRMAMCCWRGNEVVTVKCSLTVSEGGAFEVEVVTSASCESGGLGVIIDSSMACGASDGGVKWIGWD